LFKEVSRVTLKVPPRVREVTMNDPLAVALNGLAQALDAPTASGAALGNWRWTVRQRMAAVREGLARESAQAADGWAVAREYSVLRERNALMSRLATLGPRVLDSPEVERIRGELKRLVGDINHHRQRLHDLVYDEVEIEFGGSE
jgi:hypothetical protein